MKARRSKLLDKYIVEISPKSSNFLGKKAILIGDSMTKNRLVPITPYSFSQFPPPFMKIAGYNYPIDDAFAYRCITLPTLK